MNISAVLLLCGLLLLFAAAGWSWLTLELRAPCRLSGILQGDRFISGSKLAIGIFLLVLLIFALAGHAAVLIPLATAGAFFLPLLIQRTWTQYQAIPAPAYAAWYPDQSPDVIPGNYPGEKLSLTFQFPGQPGLDQPVFIEASLPGREFLGKAFLDFMYQYNKKWPLAAVELQDGQQQPYGWVFYQLELNGFREKFLDPKTLLWKQSFKPGTIIAVKRMDSRQPLSYRMKVNNPAP